MSCLWSGFGGIPSYRRYVITRARSFKQMNLCGDNEVWVEIINEISSSISNAHANFQPQSMISDGEKTILLQCMLLGNYAVKHYYILL